MNRELIGNTDMKFIYESPDKGTTVFRRAMGSSLCELVCPKCKVGSFVEVVEGIHMCTTCGFELDNVEFTLMMGYK